MSGFNSPTHDTTSEFTPRRVMHSSSDTSFSPASVSARFFATCGRGQTLKKTLLAEMKKPGGGHEVGIGDCNCNRVNKSVMCRSCGSTFRGRVRMPCPCHPHYIHLMDMVYCPSCRATNLKEFTEKSPKSQPRPQQQQNRQF